MRPGHLEALAPVCPRCLHGRGVESPVRLATVAEHAGEHVLQGVLHCSDPACWLEFPILDGVPVLVPDPRTTVSAALAEVTAREDLAPVMEGMLDDIAGPGTPRATARYHLSLYGEAHYADWSGLAAEAALDQLAREALALMGPAGAPALDLGCGVGRGAYALAARTEGPVLGADLSLPMLRMAQTLMIRGEARWPRRRTGIVHSPETARLPEEAAALAPRIDFWAVEAMALPFPAGRFGAAAALNLVDCIAGPANMLSELARVLVPGARGVLTTPYDWSGQATALENWLGGHSPRGPMGGDGAAVLSATLASLGLAETARAEGEWTLRLHDRARMTYGVDMVALRRETPA